MMNKRTDLPTIDKYIEEFLSLANDHGDQHKLRRFYARGVWLTEMREELSDRLAEGWKMIETDQTNEAVTDFWFGLLERYERICHSLDDHAIPGMRELAAEVIFQGERVENE